jgi:putative ABC transport system ATP-binding protein
MGCVLECRGVSKVYGTGSLSETVLRDVCLSLDRGQACALLGPSGSGKTTLLSILGCLLTPTSGSMRIVDQTVDHRAGRVLGEFRRTRIGFVFQHAQLLPFLSMGDNLRVVGRNAGLAQADLNDRIADLSGHLGVGHLLAKRPDHASGGQRQRVAIARALIHRPPIILADEPTAALDWANGEAAVRLLTEQARAERALLLTVTHDTRLLGFFDRVFHLEEGRLVER